MINKFLKVSLLLYFGLFIHGAFSAEAKVVDQLVFKVVNGQLVLSRANSGASASAPGDIPQSLVQFTSLIADHEISIHETENAHEMIWEFPEEMSDSVSGISFSLVDPDDSPLSFQQSEFTDWLEDEPNQSLPSFNPSIVSVPAVYTALNQMLAGTEQSFTQLVTPLSSDMNPELVEGDYRVSLQGDSGGVIITFSSSGGLTRNLYRVTLTPLTYLQLKQKIRPRVTPVDLRDKPDEEGNKKLDTPDGEPFSIWPKDIGGLFKGGGKWFGSEKLKKESEFDESWFVLMMISWLSSKGISISF
ncbi:hypothetical protein [Endozoicomonas arenosclerae]|uniref:hypothetical protein n=1 Tax=Endozoicomonas arenosclerae TaxID=1633495 RepID=UPI0007803823|nr:hypothetical protein [Endozoicomonas arenosclerae]